MYRDSCLDNERRRNENYGMKGHCFTLDDFVARNKGKEVQAGASISKATSFELGIGVRFCSYGLLEVAKLGASSMQLQIRCFPLEDQVLNQAF